MHIQTIRVNGFKGIRDLEFSPSSINIITGKNNAGKTSLLQSIKFAFNPQSIEDWGENIEYLINAKTKNATINCEYTGRQASLSEFTKSGDKPGWKNREVAIRPPRKNEALDFFVETILDVAETGPDSDYYIDRFLGRRFNFEDEISPLQTSDLDNLVRSSLSESTISACQDLSSEDIQESVVILIVNGEEYPFVYLDDSVYDSLREEIARMAARRAVTKLEQNQEVTNFKSREPVEDFYKLFSDLLIPRLGKGNFVNGTPRSEGDVLIGNTEILKRDNVDLSRNQGAVRLNNIEEYVIDKKILRNLKDLSLDYLVFEDEEEYQVPYGFMGEGFQQFITILWQIFKQDLSGSVMLFEEAENHMHPGYINKLVYALIDVAVDKEVQLFITTHNIDFIDAFFSENLADREFNFLKDNFQLLKMGRNYSEQLDYSAAKQDIKSIHTDLRGI